MAKFAKVENGNVVVINEYGGRIRTFSPNSGGKAVFADYNPSNGKILVTTERGVVIVCDDNGGQLKSFSGNGNIRTARWSGKDVFVENNNGSCELRFENGGWIRSM
ncbi:hypothetical protein SAMN05444349_11484 [Bacteroides faecichinchillae]|uniref:Uncharacterized protein n=1 Tax=Bacteroides faecichinchillae TaxID=871325 RepID=A0A1M5A6F1_9BACE|nr:hypothetical protein [Bacteroides faecichinchillae]THG68493.1 hypothetical protein E5981_04950 [Bacteroides faecichinchillae]SHF25883.1 hypothetical protein SAMN05444349_11484 [Bacteroides faecichinchillae]